MISPDEERSMFEGEGRYVVAKVNALDFRIYGFEGFLIPHVK